LHPDLIVSDVMMPEMSGEQMVGALRRYPEMENVPIVMLTAKADDALRVKLLREGVQDYVNKPFSVEELLARVGRLVNERRRSELALRESEERFRLLVQSAVDAIVITDESQRILFFNPAAERTFRCPAEDAAGSSLDRFIPSRFREAHRRHIERFMETGVTSQRIGEARELNALRANGEEFPMEASISGIKVGGQTLLAATLRDITERKAAEIKLREQAGQLREADRRKDEFLAMLAHELRNPLTPIRNAVAAVHRMPLDNPAISAACAMVDHQVEHLTRLVDDLLDISRITRGKMTLRKTRCELVALVREVVKNYRSRMEGHGLTVTLDLPDRPLWVQGDRTRLVQVVGNLLDNARKFTPSGGAVTVGLSSISEPSVSKPPAPGQAVLTVCDTGIGIEPELLPHIFEPFRQLPQGIDRGLGGLGLGLALVRSIVDLHGGEVAAESEGEGRGAVLTVRLPLEPAALLPVAVETAAPCAHNSLRVLLIEDNQEVAESTRILIELMGHRVQVARDGVEGLAAALAFRPEVVLCDIGLPGEVDGYAVARRLRQDPDLVSVYLVALTGYGHEAARELSRSAGFDQHVTKPFKAACLEELLAACSERKGMRPESSGKIE
jgi:PAS domain S-box-containing protein